MPKDAAPSDAPGVEPGLLIEGKYRIESFLGSGGMGSVWVATQLGLNRPLAVKIISPPYARSREARARFDTEAKAAAKLTSRHVVQVFDNGELPDGAPYIAMELLEGESLATRLTRGPISVAEAASFLVQIARALDRAHQLGIVHRDIKPENIFLATSHDDESGIVVKVLDFGIAKIQGDDAVSHTRTGAVLGTPLFMSPEQARAPKTVDHRTDLYSLGLVVYMMLTGKHPFDAATLAELMLQICMTPLPSLSANAPGLPAALDAWFYRAAHRDPESRFESARELAEAFAAAAVTDGAVPVQKVPRQSVAAAALATTVAALGANSSLAGASDTRRGPKPRTGSVARWVALGVVVLLGGGAASLFATRSVGKNPGQATTAPPAPPVVTQDTVASSAATTTPPPPMSTANPSVATAKQPVPVPSAVAPPKPALTTKPPPPSCTPPYYFDAHGNRLFKPECI